MGCGLYGTSRFIGNTWILILITGVRVALLVWVVMFIANMVKKYKHNNGNKEVISKLDEMFIKGEIDEEEYKLKKNIILGK